MNRVGTATFRAIACMQAGAASVRTTKPMPAVAGVDFSQTFTPDKILDVPGFNIKQQAE